MIHSKLDYKNFLEEDLKRTGLNNTFKVKWFDKRYKFYKSLRKTEYFTNCKNKFFFGIPAKLFRLRHKLLCDKYSWTIPINVCESGLAIVHSGPIVISGSAIIGKNCRIHIGVNIGRAEINQGKESGAPKLGNNVYIGPGAKLFGPIKIGDNTAIGANAVVNKSFEQGNCTIAGIPAKIISSNTSENFIL